MTGQEKEINSEIESNPKTNDLKINEDIEESTIHLGCLKDEAIHKLVEYSVGIIALDCGYQSSHQSSLDVLNDVCCDYIRKITTLLKMANETEFLRDSNSDFADSLERVFHQINVPSVANLHQFLCKSQAIRKHQAKQSQQDT